MEILLARGEGICLEATFGEETQCSYWNLFEVMEIIGKLMITPIFKFLIGTTMGCSGKIFGVTEASDSLGTQEILVLFTVALLWIQILHG